MGGSDRTLRLGTRRSLLARRQSEIVASALVALHPSLRVEFVEMQTRGDRAIDRPIYELGGKGAFTLDLEEALLAGGIDFAVHSLKDVPITQPLVPQDNLMIAAVTNREDPRDVLIASRVTSLAELSAGARIGTSSLRRRCQCLSLRNDLRLEPIRGNIDTRLRKLDAGEFDAIILALAGLKRADLFDPARMMTMSFDEMLPAPGQGALALQCRRDDLITIELLSHLDDPITRKCVDVERQLVMELHGDCHSPIAALATIDGEKMRLRAAVGSQGGGLPVRRGTVEADLSKSGELAPRMIDALGERE